MKTRNALIIGGTGLLGSGVAKSLIDNGWNVRIFSLDADTFKTKDYRIEYISGNCLNKEQLSKALEGVQPVSGKAA